LELFDAAGLFEPGRVGIATLKAYGRPSEDARYRCLVFVKFCEAARLHRLGDLRNFGCIVLQSGNAG
jgi:hypothetical protein